MLRSKLCDWIKMLFR